MFLFLNWLCWRFSMCSLSALEPNRFTPVADMKLWSSCQSLWIADGSAYPALRDLVETIFTAFHILSKVYGKCHLQKASLKWHSRTGCVMGRVAFPDSVRETPESRIKFRDQKTHKQNKTTTPPPQQTNKQTSKTKKAPVKPNQNNQKMALLLRRQYQRRLRKENCWQREWAIGFIRNILRQGNVDEVKALEFLFLYLGLLSRGWFAFCSCGMATGWIWGWDNDFAQRFACGSGKPDCTAWKYLHTQIKQCLEVL